MQLMGHRFDTSGLVPNFHPQALNLIVAISQRQFFTLYPTPNIEDNSSAPLLLPVLSDKCVALNHCAPVMRIILPHL